MGGAPRATVHLNRFDEWPAASGCRDAAAEAVRLTLRRADPGAEDDAPAGAEISVTCLSRREIRAMNRRHLSRDRPTDVIAFPLGREPVLLGDVYVCPEVAREQAEERGLRPSTELLRLVIHGVLHVLGWEHPEGEGREESEMFRMQEDLLREVLEREETPVGREDSP